MVFVNSAFIIEEQKQKIKELKNEIININKKSTNLL